MRFDTVAVSRRDFVAFEFEERVKRSAFTRSAPSISAAVVVSFLDTELTVTLPPRAMTETTCRKTLPISGEA